MVEVLLRSLGKELANRTILPGDDAYDAARSLWNADADRRPAAVVRCLDTGDVALAIRSAREAGYRLSVRGGGHQIAGTAVVDDGVVVDLSQMNKVRYIGDGRVQVQGGALLGAVDVVCAEQGRTVPTGIVSHTGVAGLTLGGGIGWLSRHHGLSCDWLRRAQVVGSDGTVRTADAGENADLFWALRGGGGNFGAVTLFEFDSVPLRPVLYGYRVYSAAMAAEVLSAYGERVLPREIGVMIKGRRDRDGDPALFIEFVHSGHSDDFAEVAGLLDFGPVLREGQTVRPFGEVQRLSDKVFPHGRHYYQKAGHLTGLGPTVAKNFQTALESLPPGEPLIEIVHLGGAIRDIAQADTSYPGRDVEFGYTVMGSWTDPQHAQPSRDWARATHESFQTDAERTTYLNFASDQTAALRHVFGTEAYQRLVDAKRRYDPDETFQPHMPIPAQAQAGAGRSDSPGR